MIELVVCGALGRMGRAITEAADAEKDAVAIAGLVEAPGHPGLGKTVAVGGRQVTVASELPRLPKAVLIDFTSPDATLAHVREAVSHEWAAVVGTTGLTDHHRLELEHASRRIALLHATNMSVGMNLLWALARRAAETLGLAADIEIIEAHHNKKKDAPSGSAMTIAETVTAARQQPLSAVVHGREGLVGERRPGEVGMHAVRAGDIVGDHTILFGLPGERLELIHRAHTREGFARGAIRAARYVAAAKPGLYRMSQVLGLE